MRMRCVGSWTQAVCVHALTLHPCALQISTPDALGRILLHACAGSGTACSLETLGFLLDAFPAGCRVKDLTGRTPLHSACISASARLEVVTALTAAGGGSVAVTERDNDGATALHLAAACAAPLEVVHHLLAVCPDAALIPDAGGALALHAAAEAGATGSVLAALLKAHPEGAALLVAGLRPVTAWLSTHAAIASVEVQHLQPLLISDAALAERLVHELAAFPPAANALKAATDAHPTLPDTLEPEPLSAPGPRLSALQVACPPCRIALLSGGRLLRRFALTAIPAASTADSKLYLCDDASLPPGSYHRRVALKVIRKRERFQRELSVRAALGGTSCESIVPVLHSFYSIGPQPDVAFAEEAPLRGLWPQMLVLPRADASLTQALASRADGADGVLGRDWRAARSLARALAQCVRDVHAGGFVHGNLTPNHFLRTGDSLGGTWRLVHLDGCVTFSSTPGAGEFISDDVSPAYAPPELCLVDETTQHVDLKMCAERGVLEAWEPGSLRASLTFDMWGLGCCLYHVFVGAPLWAQSQSPAADAVEAQAETECMSPTRGTRETHAAVPPLPETLTQAQLRQLAAWSEADLEKALEPLTNHCSAAPEKHGAVGGSADVASLPMSPSKAASNSRSSAATLAAAQLLRSLLHPSPKQRCASIDAVLAHPFFGVGDEHSGAQRMSGWSVMDVASAVVAPPSAPGSPVQAARPATEQVPPTSPPSSTWRDLSDSLLSAVSAFNISLTRSATATVPGGTTTTAAMSPKSASSGAPSINIGPPPAAVVGPFPRTSLARLGGSTSPRDGASAQYPSAAAVAADRVVMPYPLHVRTEADAGTGLGSTFALSSADGESMEQPLVAPIASWAAPLPASPRGTVAATRSLVGVPAVPGGAKALGSGLQP